MPAPLAPAPPFHAFRISLFYAGYFSVGGVFVPFLPVWLDFRGLTAEQVAICIAAPLALRAFVTPLVGWLVDRLPNRRFAIRILCGGALGSFAFANSVEGFPAILAVTMTAFLCWQLALPAAEALALTGVRRFGLDFGRMRLFGSLSFMVVNLVSGAVLAQFAPDAIFWAILLVFAMAALVSITLPVTPPEVRALDDALRPAPPSAWTILGHRDFVALLVAGSLVQSAHAMLYGFASLRWAALGFSEVQIGALWAAGIISEVALFSVSRAAGRIIGAVWLMVLGGVGSILRWGLFPFDLDFGGYLALQLLHGLSFAASFLGLQLAIARDVPEQITVTAQSLVSMVGGIMMATTTAIAGPLYHAFGATGFLAMIIPAAAALAILAAVQPGRRAEGRAE